MRTFAHPTTERAPVDLNELIVNVVIVTANEYREVADIDTAVADLRRSSAAPATSARS
jgi:hypothetical protein